MAKREATPKPMAELLKELEQIVVQRIEELETGHRRMKRLLGVAGLLALALIAAAGATVYASFRAGLLGGAAPSIRSREFVLTDEVGTVRGVWTMTEDGATRLSMQDRDGVLRLKLTVLDGGAPGIAFADESGQSRIVLGLLPDQTSTLVFADRGGEARAVLGLSAEEAARLIFADRYGVIRAGFGVAADGKAGLTLDEEDEHSPPHGSN